MELTFSVKKKPESENTVKKRMKNDPEVLYIDKYIYLTTKIE